MCKAAIVYGNIKGEKMSNISISVIIPIYNDEKHVEVCLKSICSQTCKNIEIIFVDDCSEDKSVSIIQKKMEKDDRIHLIRLSSNHSAFVARKKGVEKASGEYILFCDADDYVSSKLCDELLAIQKKADVDILHFSTDVVNYGGGIAETEKATDFFKIYEGKIFGKDVFRQCFIEESYHYNLWNKLFKKEL